MPSVTQQHAAFIASSLFFSYSVLMYKGNLTLLPRHPPISQSPLCSIIWTSTPGHQSATNIPATIPRPLPWHITTNLTDSPTTMPLCYPKINTHTAAPYHPTMLPFWDSLTLKMKTLCCSIHFLRIYQTTVWFQNPTKSTTEETSILEGQYYMNTEHETPKTTINKLDSRVVE